MAMNQAVAVSNLETRRDMRQYIQPMGGRDSAFVVVIDIMRCPDIIAKIEKMDLVDGHARQITFSNEDRFD